MVAEDGIGRPRPPDVVERDELVAAGVARLGAETGIRIRELAADLELEQPAVHYSLRRLQREGRVARRDGYRWWPL